MIVTAYSVYLQQLSLAIIIICMTMHYVLVHTYIHIYHSVYVHMQHIQILVSMCIYLCLAVCSYVECVCLIVCMLQCAQMYACDLCVYNVYMYAHANFSFAPLHCSYMKFLCYTFIEKLTSIVYYFLLYHGYSNLNGYLIYSFMY